MKQVGNNLSFNWFTLINQVAQTIELGITLY